jgi:hypothetical protein
MRRESMWSPEVRISPQVCSTLSGSGTLPARSGMTCSSPSRIAVVVTSQVPVRKWHDRIGDPHGR